MDKETNGLPEAIPPPNSNHRSDEQEIEIAKLRAEVRRLKQDRRDLQKEMAKVKEYLGPKELARILKADNEDIEEPQESSEEEIEDEKRHGFSDTSGRTDAEKKRDCIRTLV